MGRYILRVTEVTLCLKNIFDLVLKARRCVYCYCILYRNKFAGKAEENVVKVSHGSLRFGRDETVGWFACAFYYFLIGT